MFNLHNFVIKTLSTMKSRLDEYQVRAYALSWYSKSVLTDEDMLTIESWYSSATEEDTEISNGDFEEDVTLDTEKEN